MGLSVMPDLQMMFSPPQDLFTIEMSKRYVAEDIWSKTNTFVYGVSSMDVAVTLWLFRTCTE
ncbi:hypothetical protein ASF11_03545 [Acidovorax sp. Leaf76]|nr:hypothetical protein ASF11_03545 [Acidovorax sp. Leaf76]KQO40530.1 hypothetical protein ASF19_02585 [Acidovorax sp. Leaf84]KQS42673.1 hypothetical protein ASG27_02520 [Acidovorax sp. Leaf191]